MHGVARLPASERAALFRETAAQLGLGELVVEKDFWVCWVLLQLGSAPALPPLLFKGGTSLSKCFGLIARFSEDIDLGIERDAAGLADAAPTSSMGSSASKRARRHLGTATRDYISTTLQPAVEAALSRGLGDPVRLASSHAGDETSLDFEYPRALQEASYRAGAYVAPAVKLELGARSDHHPTREAVVSPYCADVAPDWFEQAGATVVAQAPERTLVEKALILHTANHVGRIPPRSSRHAYDLARLVDGGVLEAVTRDLYREVAEHKRVFAGDAHAGRAPASGIDVVPAHALLRGLQDDYRSMREMFFQEPPAFADVLERLAEIERRLTALLR